MSARSEARFAWLRRVDQILTATAGAEERPATRPGTRAHTIPPRAVTMWPDHPRPLPPTTAAAADGVGPAATTLAELRGLSGHHQPSERALSRTLAIVRTLAPALYERPDAQRQAVIAQVGEKAGITPDELTGLLLDASHELTGRHTQRDPRNGGLAELDALRHADPAALTRAVTDTLNQRVHATAYSDPDLPRLWMMFNGAYHNAPAETMLTVPAIGRGPKGSPVRRADLLGWRGITTAVSHLDQLATAATEGRRWLESNPTSPDAVLLGLGVVDLTHPTLARALAAAGPGLLPPRDIAARLARFPSFRDAVGLSDAALAEACDRAGWLLGAGGERPYAPRRPGASPSRPTARAAGKSQPGDIAAIRSLLRVASTEAAARFGGLTINRLSAAEAYAGRYPHSHLTTAPTADAPTPPTPLPPPPTASLEM